MGGPEPRPPGKHLALKNEILSEVIPKTLQEFLGLEAIIDRLPQTYIDSTLSAYLASRFVYAQGLHPDEFSFYNWMGAQKKAARAKYSK